jgi:Putative auto-transporter adhesin, head GIN domain
MIATHLRRFAFTTLIALVAGSAAAATIAGSGNLQTEARAVSGFTGIALSVPGRVEVTMGERESFSITADDNILPHIETVVERGMLKIRWRDHVNVSRVKSIRIAITAKALDALNVGGSGDIVGTSLRTGDLKVNIGGSGNVKLPGLTAAALSVSIGGSGDFSGDGKAETLTANIGGSGDVKAGRLAVQGAKISVAGSGSTTVWAKNELTVNVAGSGSVRYYGDPVVTRAVVGSGSVRRLGATPA